MAFIIAIGTTGLGVQYNLGTTDSVYVPRNVNVTSTDDTAIANSGSNQIVTIGGAVNGDFYGVQLGDFDNDIGNQLWVLAGGAVLGSSSGISIEGAGARIENAGLISGENGGSGISLQASGSAKTTINNSGLIFGGNALQFGTNQTAPIDITNTGQLMATGTEALNADTYLGAIRLFNRGFILGAVEFGEASDFFDGRGGTVQGNIVGRNGNDIFLPGSGAENINGDGGSTPGLGDRLDFRDTAGINVAFDGTFANTGTAAGDVYSNIENIYGSLTGNDFLVGNGAGNHLAGFGGNDNLFGRAGADVLAGAAGNDTLAGGLGLDTLNGGLGIDRFRFDILADAGDIIQDFDTTDFIVVKGSIFGGLPIGGLAANRFHVNATGNTAINGTQRFIFEADSDRLWFDSNGSTAGGTIVMVADLSTNFNMTNLDIRLF